MEAGINRIEEILYMMRLVFKLFVILDKYSEIHLHPTGCVFFERNISSVEMINFVYNYS